MSHSKQSKTSYLGIRLLPSYFKKIALFLIFGVLLMLVLAYFRVLEGSIWKLLIHHGIIISMFLLAVSKDKIEDEYTLFLRTQSFVLAFMIGTLYAIIHPYVYFLINSPDNLLLFQSENFQLLFFMLFIQLMYYHILKKIA